MSSKLRGEPWQQSRRISDPSSTPTVGAKRGDKGEVLGIEPVRTPTRDIANVGGELVVLIRGVGRVEEFGVGVAHDNGAAESAQPGEDFPRLRSRGGDVTEADDVVGAFLVDRVQRGFQRRQVAVDVRDQRDAHHRASFLCHTGAQTRGER